MTVYVNYMFLDVSSRKNYFFPPCRTTASQLRASTHTNYIFCKHIVYVPHCCTRYTNLQDISVGYILRNVTALMYCMSFEPVTVHVNKIILDVFSNVTSAAYAQAKALGDLCKSTVAELT